MAKHPLLFGVWHGYKMAVLRVCNAYRALWTTLEFTCLLKYPNTASVLRAHDCIVMERMVLAVILAAPRLGNCLRRSITGAMRQRILGSHTPPCHKRMVITT